ncbi:MAG: dihydroorotate dehydrogenase-like protein [Pirellulaceae bacterium]
MGVDLTTNYLGLTLRNPLIVAACPLTRESQRVMELEQAGAAAAVMYSLFAEQVDSDPLSRIGHAATETGGVNVAPLPNDYVVGVDAYLKNIELTKKAVSIPIIASLNGSDLGDWINFAALMEQAGADALELNIYFVPTDPNTTGSQVEDRYCEIVAAVRDQIKIPLSVKLGPFFSSLPNFAGRLCDLGVNGLVLFNRFLQPDIDVDTLEVAPRLTLSSSDALRLPLRWIAILREQLPISLAASSGAHDATDVAKLILAGADVVSMESVLLEHGPHHVATVLEELTGWMEAHDFESIEQIRGAVMRRPGADPTAFERANYIKTIISYDKT